MNKYLIWHNTCSILELMIINDLALLDIFLRAHHLKSFSKVAIQLGVTPSVISKKIGVLESSLRVTLFKRTTRQIQLTAEGKKLVEVAERILGEVKKLEGELTHEQAPESLSGNLRISSPETYANSRLVELIAKFCGLHPKVHVDLVLTNSFLNLTEENIDLAIRIFKPVDSSLKSVKLEQNELVFCASPGFLKKHGPIRSVKQLQKHDVLFLSSHSSERFKKSGLSMGQTFKEQRISANSGETINQFCLHGFGIAVRSLWDVQRYIDAKKLVQLDLDDHIESKSAVYAIFSDSGYLPRRTRAFIDFLKQNLK